MNKKALTVIIGFIAIALGIGYTLAACGLIEPFSIFVPGWWTVFLIVPGLVMLFSRDSNKFVSLCLITIGVVLFLQKNDLLGDIKKYIIPALLIIFGLSLIINTIINSSKKKTTIIPNYPADGSIPVFESSFAEVCPDYSGKDFKGCSIDITFGSGKLDLRNSKIDQEVNIFINAAFAGVNIKLPPGCRVEVETSTSFAGVDNKYISSTSPNAPLVHVFASVSFGGVEIK